MDVEPSPSGRQHVEWVPKQEQPREIHDYRAAARGPKGYKDKRKRCLEEQEELHQQDLCEAAAAAQAMHEDGAGQHSGQAVDTDMVPSSKRRKAEGVPYIPVSGRTWKAPAQRSGVIMKPKSNADWDKKMALKAARTNFLTHKREAEAAGKAKRKAKADQRRASDELKKANRAKSEVVQVITNNATLKKMMKSRKQKKTLRKADTNPSATK